jgi:hypothetical protein
MYSSLHMLSSRSAYWVIRPVGFEAVKAVAMTLGGTLPVSSTTSPTSMSLSRARRHAAHDDPGFGDLWGIHHATRNPPSTTSSAPVT